MKRRSYFALSLSPFLFLSIAAGLSLSLLLPEDLDSQTLDGNLKISLTHLIDQIEIRHLIEFDENMSENV